MRFAFGREKRTGRPNERGRPGNVPSNANGAVQVQDLHVSGHYVFDLHDVLLSRDAPVSEQVRKGGACPALLQVSGVCQVTVVWAPVENVDYSFKLLSVRLLSSNAGKAAGGKDRSAILKKGLDGGGSLRMDMISIGGGGGELLAKLGGQVVGVTERGGNAEAPQALPDEFQAGVEVGQVSGGDIDRLDAVSGAEYEADDLFPVAERYVIAPVQIQRIVLAAEQFFRAAHRGKVQAESEMRGEPQPARMCDALPVAQEHVRRTP